MNVTVGNAYFVRLGRFTGIKDLGLVYRRELLDKLTDHFDAPPIMLCIRWLAVLLLENKINLSLSFGMVSKSWNGSPPARDMSGVPRQN